MAAGEHQWPPAFTQAVGTLSLLAGGVGSDRWALDDLKPVFDDRARWRRSPSMGNRSHAARRRATLLLADAGCTSSRGRGTRTTATSGTFRHPASRGGGRFGTARRHRLRRPCGRPGGRTSRCPGSLCERRRPGYSVTHMRPSGNVEEPHLRTRMAASMSSNPTDVDLAAETTAWRGPQEGEARRSKGGEAEDRTW